MLQIDKELRLTSAVNADCETVKGLCCEKQKLVQKLNAMKRSSKALQVDVKVLGNKAGVLQDLITKACTLQVGV